MVGGFASWVSQLLSSDPVYAEDRGAEPETVVEVVSERAFPREALANLDRAPAAVPAGGALRHLIGGGDRTSAMMAAMSGPGLCTPRR